MHTLARKEGETLQSYIDKPVDMGDAGGNCWPMYSFGGGCNYTIIKVE